MQEISCFPFYPLSTHPICPMNSWFISRTDHAGIVLLVCQILTKGFNELTKVFFSWCSTQGYLKNQIFILN